jgi:polysaccharide pyruvyl transferase WcaK-like protein
VKHVCVWGTSLKKIGDEAQNIAFVRTVRHRYPEAKITLFSQFGERMTRLVANEGIEVETIRTARLIRVFRAISASDLFVFEGGPFYEDLAQALRCLLLLGMAKGVGVPVVVYGATAFHFKTWWGRRIYRYIFNHVDALTVREAVAVEIIKDLGVAKEVELFSDPRFILDPPPDNETSEILAKEGIDPRKPFIILTARYLHSRVPKWVKRSHDYVDETVNRANHAMAKMAAYLEDRAQLLILPMHPTLEEDREMARVFRTQMRDASRLKVLSHRYTALEMIGMIKMAEMIVASRLGSAVFSTMTGTPIVAIAYEPRMTDHMRRIGLEQYVHDWKDLNYEDLVKDIEEVWTGRHQFRENMKHKAGELRKMAWKNAELLSQYL